MKKYTDSEMRELTKLRDEIFSKEDLEIDSMTLLKWVIELYRSNIPNEYWKHNFDNLKLDNVLVKKNIKKFISHLDNAFKEGLGIMFYGPNGTGKTTLACEIGKHALFLNKSVYYMELDKYISSVSLKDKDPDMEMIYHRAWYSDMVIIDEIDKAYQKKDSDWTTTQFIKLIKGITAYNKVLITCMNSTEEELKEKYGNSLYSALQRHLKPMPVSGDDYSKNLQKDWNSKLTGDNFGLFSEGIMQQAMKYDEAMLNFKKEEYDEVW